MRFSAFSWVNSIPTTATRLLARVPPFCWFSNDVPLVLAKSDGQLVVCQGGHVRPISVQMAKRKSHWGIELPEDLVLIRKWDIPVQDADEKSAALSLAVAMSSPFAAEDGVWGHDSNSTGGCVAVMASRNHIRAYAQRLSQTHGLEAVRDPEQCEVLFWPPSGVPVVLAGFAESVRSGQVRRNKLMTYVFLAFSLLAAAAILATPFAQLALQADSAQAQFQVAQAETKPAQALREALLSTQSKLVALSKISLENQHPSEILARVTAVVPDDTWVQRLQWQSGKVTLQGQTPNVATLMASLSRQPDIKEVKAPSAATKSVGSGKENFTVEFVLLTPTAPAVDRATGVTPEKAGTP